MGAQTHRKIIKCSRINAPRYGGRGKKPILIMKLTYSLLILDEDGNSVLDHELTADEAMLIVAPHIGKVLAPQAEIVQDAPAVDAASPKRTYKKRADAPALKVKG